MTFLLGAQSHGPDMIHVQLCMSDVTLHVTLSAFIYLRTDRRRGAQNRTFEIKTLSSGILAPLIPNASKPVGTWSGQRVEDFA